MDILSRFTSNPSEEHWSELKRLMRSLKYTLNFGIHYECEIPVLECYSDANWALDKKGSKSISEWAFTIGGSIMVWSSK